ncbi:hypothetical protein KIH74_08935 [Kineosporia sp. J2-2]|uniref:Uncharacterized protein n=1 Tax=Kineosporia corallincola TaxID=2835133 RepID=A0ABS5TD79_9ACTN|nr:hypothetical protein [Kineosporia corallincola]MBT0769050.1 hypothetical protein [Kineosporia corallincola]
MAVRGARLAGRFLDGAVDVVHDRAPAVSERAYRTVAGPLMAADPAGTADAVGARLDSTRDRVAGMAARGSVPSAAARRVRRDLARTRMDVELIAPRLPVVQSRCLVQRSTAYGDALQNLSARPAGRSPREQAWNAAVLVGSPAVWIGVLLLVQGPVVATLLGLVAGAVTAVALTGARTRRAGRDRLNAIAEALARADVLSAGPSSVKVPGLDRERRVLLERARTSGRLDDRGLTLLRSIDDHLDDLLVRLIDGELQADAVHLVQATVERYLPDSLEPFMALADAQTLVRGRPAAVEVADQLAAIEAALADLVRRPSPNRHEQQLFLQGEFLRSKFGAPQSAS